MKGVMNMAHFAKIEDGVVRQVIVVNNADCGNLEFPDSEPIGNAFINSIGLPGVWKQTSYNNNFRGTYAGTGFKFDPDLGEHGEFVSPAAPEVAEPPSE
jgi:hypothetical protein